MLTNICSAVQNYKEVGMHFLKTFHFHPTKMELGLLGIHTSNHTS